ncbi:hypothetical protein Snoj_13590 [Streptomyces nojiriensis]|uniref:Uncharacterized protein n=1 Tax=Streptomyces nojiriensis TaxID=66374 RepID=A0ABQ3SH48_9ACTN|nr:hypothetical protein GCM10010205_43420 [Streptomyces nojiriensis]GHI67441.1 hypothetical protein Snoj_13590 [Streptomyces nojiriensis]
MPPLLRYGCCCQVAAPRTLAHSFSAMSCPVIWRTGPGACAVHDRAVTAARSDGTLALVAASSAGAVPELPDGAAGFPAARFAGAPAALGVAADALGVGVGDVGGAAEADADGLSTDGPVTEAAAWTWSVAGVCVPLPDIARPSAPALRTAPAVITAARWEPRMENLMAGMAN